MQIWPSLLAADLLNLYQQITSLCEAGVTQIHLDIMDNHYVPNLSFSADFCQAIHKQFPQVEIDVHLMTTPVNDFIEAFAHAGAKRISIHANTTLHLNDSLHRIQQLGCRVGLAINPGEDISHLRWCTHQLDYVLLMMVNPGFGGQTMLPFVIEKAKNLHALYPQLPIMVDGGINLDNIPALKSAGVTEFVVGSSLFKAKNFPHCIQDFLQVIQHP